NLVRTTPPEGVKLREQPYNLETTYKYNSLNQLVWQSTPDGGITKFAYDGLGRIIASQNAKQASENKFSYSQFDGLGRVIEAGQMQLHSNYSINDIGKLVNVSTGEIVGENVTSSQIDILLNNPENNNTKEEVTKTFYNDPTTNGLVSYLTQENLRNRIGAVAYYPSLNAGANVNGYDNILFYSYDIHGRVIEIATYIKHQELIDKGQALKKLEYEYDLISGNVKLVTYQKGELDQFIHRYAYDADNRIVNVQTSKDGVIWEQDASYEYYEHGPLARTVLGDKEVQGMDYAYTLQGWLKGVNSEYLDPNNDIGKDGLKNTFFDSSTAKDAFGYSLSYFRGDYKAINGDTKDIGGTTVTNAFSMEQFASSKDLFNGNIKTMTTGLLDLDGNSLGTTVSTYEYDLLDRIISYNGAKYTSENYVPFDVEHHFLARTKYRYDRNGNLEGLLRYSGVKDGTYRLMDDLRYTYAADRNQLKQVRDAVTTTSDIASDFENTHDYTYDAIGQLTSDIAENIELIDWRVDGKVSEISKTTGQKIRFGYSPLGNRLYKSN
ncbi:RHS repeat domain-containing protein, partial [Aureivirga marina]|uniref:hypothetical protein n=1 Tax=Aureivirga marina TaxID=1182451 RepID=UPI0018CA21F6